MAANKPHEKIFAPHVQGKAQSATYATVKESVIQYIQKTYKDGNDVAQSLKDGEVFDLTKVEPVRAISTEKDEAMAVLEQGGFDIKYQEELRRFLDRKDNLRQNLIKAYALIFTSYCNRTMQSRIEEHPDFESKIENNPIELLEAIKTLMHDPIRAQYPMASMSDALTRLINVKQMDNEPLLDYVKRFKQLRDVVKGYLGTRILDTFIEQTEEYRKLSEAEKLLTTAKEDAFNAWMAYLLIKGSDQSKYGSLIKGFVSQYSLGNDQYPKMIQMATDVLSNHKLDQKYFDNLKKHRVRQHDAKDEQQDSETPPATSFAQKDVICYICGVAGHTKPECPDAKKIPRAKWAINQAMGGMQATKSKSIKDDEKDDSDDESIKSEASTSSRSAREHSRKKDSGWSSLQRPIKIDVSQVVHKQTKQGTDEFEESLKHVILLDTGSSIGATFTNPDLITNIRVTQQPIQMNTNAGYKVLGLEGQVPGFEKAYYDPTMMTNIFGFAELVSKYRIVYDSDVEDAFKVYTKDGIIKFKQNQEGLYVYKPTTNYMKSVARQKGMNPPVERHNYLVSSVEENKMGYTKRQFEDAKRARRLYHIVGCPTVENFKHILRQNIIKNCPVTIEDVNIAERIFGPDIGALKGKTVHKSPIRVKEDLVEVPPELKDKHKNLIFCMDIMFVNGMPMLTGIDRSLRFRSLVPLENRTARELYKKLDVILRPL